MGKYSAGAMSLIRQLSPPPSKDERLWMPIYFKDFDLEDDDFSDEEIGKLLRAVLAYGKRGEIVDLPDRSLRRLFRSMQPNMDFDRIKYFAGQWWGLWMTDKRCKITDDSFEDWLAEKVEEQNERGALSPQGENPGYVFERELEEYERNPRNYLSEEEIAELPQ